jgi:1,4-alpha-glucan branching enzyme
MKKLFLFLLTGLYCAAMNAQLNRIPRVPTPNDNLVSFEVNADGSATFRLYAPDAKSVELGGDRRAEKVDRADNGVWTMTTRPDINPSAYRYFFMGRIR